MIKTGSFAGRVLLTALLLTSINGWAQTPLLLLDFEFVEEMHDPRTAEADQRRLALVNVELKEQMAACAAFRLEDSAPAMTIIERARSRMAYLHRCNGCAEDIGAAANTQLVLFPWVQKVSNLILNLNAEIRSASADQVVAARSVDIRGNTDRGWQRGAKALAKRLCELDGERINRHPVH